ncbi:MAG TPA: hypothetical protein PKN92_11910, partial [Candidatus Hydrogenedentes bacterium]|nr:hypothetical protein [Candidatus Hydrogenedentota bacterium]
MTTTDTAAQDQKDYPEQEQTFGEKLLQTIDTLPDDTVTLVEIRDLIGQEGLLLFTIFLNLIF